VNLPWLAVKAVVIGALCGTGVLVGANAVTAPASEREHRTNVAASAVVTASAPVARNAPNVTRVPSEPNAVSIVEHGAISSDRAIERVAPQATVERRLGDVALARSSLSKPRTQDPEPAPAVAQPSAIVDVRGPSLDAESVSGFGVAPPTAASASASASAPSSMGEEIAAIDRVRQDLQQGNARLALGELERYEVRWPNGVFALEAVVLRVEAMLVSGDRAAAERAARRVLAAQPNSRHAARLRALLGSSKSSDPIPASSTR
jgi:hypothetical protein